MTIIPWIWQASVSRIVDGDTLDVTIDVGFRATRYERIRLLGVNCPEMHGDSHEAGRAACDFTRNWVHATEVAERLGQWPFIIQTHKADSFGRYLARVWPASSKRETDSDLSALLIEHGHAVAFKE
jgi:micrococcal nuclease